MFWMVWERSGIQNESSGPIMFGFVKRDSKYFRFYALGKYSVASAWGLGNWSFCPPNLEGVVDSGRASDLNIQITLNIQGSLNY